MGDKASTLEERIIGDIKGGDQQRAVKRLRYQKNASRFGGAGVGLAIALANAAASQYFQPGMLSLALLSIAGILLVADAAGYLVLAAKAKSLR